jgi:hypothetical protein
MLKALKEVEMQDTGKQRTNEKDQFYTMQSVASDCVRHLLSYSTDTMVWVEPSAGKGVFIEELQKQNSSIDWIALDIDPQNKLILQQDYLEWMPEKHTQYIVFGNPPFGKQSSLAKKFIKHSSKFATILGFILPKSFTKPSMQKAFPLKFHCVFEKELPQNSFLVNDTPYDVPCVFQIWERKQDDRIIPPEMEVEWTYVKQHEPHSIVVRRVGGRAGKCFLPMNTFSTQSHYFIRFPSSYKKFDSFVEAMNIHTFPSNTTGPRSLSKSEINLVINEYASLIEQT